MNRLVICLTKAISLQPGDEIKRYVCGQLRTVGVIESVIPVHSCRKVNMKLTNGRTQVEPFDEFYYVEKVVRS